MTTAEIRRAFLDYFKRNDHSEVASSPLVTGDPTLIFTNAGMVQFKDAFLGLEKRAYTRAVTSQKCMRVSGKHNDLENVGPSPRHHTFFEMLGNFSFGDYFKRDAIRYAYELVTKVYGLPPERLAFTVFENDDEAYDIWVNEIKVDPRRVARMGPKTNFWQMADVGPCGPTSEIHWDKYPEQGVESIIPMVQAEDDRFLELWNLVFMQFNRRQTAEGFVDDPLPKPGVDTGMGLERIASVVQGVNANYDTDLFLPIMDAIQEDLRHDDATREKNYIAYRVIADHGRAMTFLLADGVLPGNVDSAYVLRMVMRRAMRFGKKMGVTRPFLGDVARAVIHQMKDHYTELSERQDFIIKAIAQEEERFQQTLERGLEILDEIIASAQARGEKIIDGREAFRLWDTYGFPLDLSRDVVNERGMTIDEVGYQQALEEQRERARAVEKFTLGSREETYRALALPDIPFLGYESLEAAAQIMALVRDGQVVTQAVAGEALEIVLNQTPFYAESGGQIGDTGQITAEIGEGQFIVEDTQRPIHGVIVHSGRVKSGVLRQGAAVRCAVDGARRRDVVRNHTATHLLHKALHEIIGTHATQRGSLVAPDRLRFDFNHLTAVSRDELSAIEARVNELILCNAPVHSYVTSREEAFRAGAMALFGEKYGDQVRVICVAQPPKLSRTSVALPGAAPMNEATASVGSCYSRELCGGTHVNATGEIGTFFIVGESAVGAGVRRIEAVTGNSARAYLRQRLTWLDGLAGQLQATPEQATAKLQSLLSELEASRKLVEQLQRDAARGRLDDLLQRSQEIHGVKLVSAQVNAASLDMMREMCDWLRDKLESGVIVLGAVIKDRPALIVAVTADWVGRGLRAGDIIKPLAQVLGGSGGGRPNLAQAGGKDADKLPEALGLAATVVGQSLKK